MLHYILYVIFFFIIFLFLFFPKQQPENIIHSHSLLKVNFSIAAKKAKLRPAQIYFYEMDFLGVY